MKTSVEVDDGLFTGLEAKFGSQTAIAEHLGITDRSYRRYRKTGLAPRPMLKLMLKALSGEQGGNHGPGIAA